MPFRILSLDGGGIRGLIAARILEQVEAQLGQPLNEYFHLIAGTSTGSLLAAGIAIGLRPKELREIYETQGQRIFPYTNLFSPRRLGLILKYGLSAPKFSDEGLTAVARQYLGQKTLADITPNENSPKLLITSYDTIRRRPFIFKSWRHRDNYAQVPVWEACVASASAPTYFPAHALRIEEKGTAQGGDSKTIKLEHQASKLEDDYNEMPIQITAGTGQGQTRTIKNYDGAARVAEVDQPWNIQPDATSEYLIPNLFSLLDGGVGANNPIACAVAEAIRLLGESERQIPMNEIINEIQVLSIGTGDRTTPIALKTAQGSGLLEWGRRLVDVLMDAPSDIHQYVTEQLLDESAQCYLRLQFKIDKTLINQIQAETGYNLSPALDDATPGNLTALNKAADLYIAKRAKTQLAGFLRC